MAICFYLLSLSKCHQMKKRKECLKYILTWAIRGDISMKMSKRITGYPVSWLIIKHNLSKNCNMFIYMKTMEEQK